MFLGFSTEAWLAIIALVGTLGTALFTYLKDSHKTDLDAVGHKGELEIKVSEQFRADMKAIVEEARKITQEARLEVLELKKENIELRERNELLFEENQKLQSQVHKLDREVLALNARIQFLTSKVAEI